MFDLPWWLIAWLALSALGAVLWFVRGQSTLLRGGHAAPPGPTAAERDYYARFPYARDIWDWD